MCISASQGKVPCLPVGFLTSVRLLKGDRPFFANRTQKVRKNECALMVAIIDLNTMVALNPELTCVQTEKYVKVLK